MAGKNKIETGLRILYDDSGGTARDLSGDLIPGSLAVNGFTYEEIDMTGVANAITNYLAGRASLDISAQFHLNDTASTGAYTVLISQDGRNGGSGDQTLTIQFGSAGAAPDTGDPELEGEFGLFGIPVSISGGTAVITATWRPNTSTAPAWGTVS